MDKNIIRFNYLVDPFYFPARIALKAFLTNQIGKEGRAIDTINYIFCSDSYLININRSFLDHDTYTDIITFELSGKNEPLIADIYISVERVAENATSYKTTFQQELHRVIFHGALHLCGFKDKSKAQSTMMRVKENEWLSLYFVPRGTTKQKD